MPKGPNPDQNPGLIEKEYSFIDSKLKDIQSVLTSDEKAVYDSIVSNTNIKSLLDEKDKINKESLESYNKFKQSIIKDVEDVKRLDPYEYAAEMEYLKLNPQSRWDNNSNSDKNYESALNDVEKIEDKLIKAKLTKEQLEQLDKNDNFIRTDLKNENKMDDDLNNNDLNKLDPDVIEAKKEFMKHEEELKKMAIEDEKIISNVKSTNNKLKNKSFIQMKNTKSNLRNRNGLR